jgi:hypothetical protein
MEARLPECARGVLWTFGGGIGAFLGAKGRRRSGRDQLPAQSAADFYRDVRSRGSMTVVVKGAKTPGAFAPGPDRTRR